MHAGFYLFTAFGFSPLVAVAQGVDTAAIFLLVEMFPFGNLKHSARPAAFAPVVIPIAYAVIAACGAVATAVDLVKVFPPRNPKA